MGSGGDLIATRNVGYKSPPPAKKQFAAKHLHYLFVDLLAALGVASHGAGVHSGFSRLIISVGVRNLRTPGVLVAPMPSLRMQRLIGLFAAAGPLSGRPRSIFSSG